MKKLAGLLAFGVALACAILITQYYKKPAPPPAPPPPPVPAVTQVPPAPPTTGANVPVTFKTQLVTLDFSLKRAGMTLLLERNPSASTPERVWVWAYFFTQESPGKYCEGGPVEVKKPFDASGRASVTVALPVTNCPTPKTPSTTYYARVNVSTESAFAARLPEQRISYDITQASPVTLQGTRK